MTSKPAPAPPGRPAVGASARGWLVLLAVIVAAATACAGSGPQEPSPGSSETGPAAPAEPGAGQPRQVRLRVESRVADVPTGAFRSRVVSILSDPRGWQRAGLTFVLPEGTTGEAAAYRLVLAEGEEVDRLCAPYDTGGEYSCQNGPVVALNAERWRTATASWPGTLDGYRTMLVNHEVGHLLHLHHPRPQCPGAGLPAPVMAQQSTQLGACEANPWPLAWEIELAAQTSEPLAPPADHDVSDHRPSPPPARS